jgi:hypothetical protein
MGQKSFRWKSDTLFTNMKGFDERCNKAVGAAVEFQSVRSEAYMKKNATWKDRTGNARNGLFTATKHEGNSHSLLLSHSVSYGIWLEVRDGGKYGIIIDAWLRGTVELTALLGKLFANAGKGK